MKTGQVRSRSLKMAPFDRSHTSSYSPSIVSMALSGKTRMIGLPSGEKNCDDMLSRFHLIPERNGQMDRHDSYINIAR